MWSCLTSASRLRFYYMLECLQQLLCLLYRLLLWDENSLRRLLGCSLRHEINKLFCVAAGRGACKHWKICCGGIPPT